MPKSLNQPSSRSGISSTAKWSGNGSGCPSRRHLDGRIRTDAAGQRPGRPRPLGPQQRPNNSPAEAQPVTLPVIVNGRVNPTLDQDCFRFAAKQGQRLVAAAMGHGLDAHTAYRAGYLDARLELSDSGGNVIASAESPAPGSATFAAVGREFECCTRLIQLRVLPASP